MGYVTRYVNTRGDRIMPATGKKYTYPKDEVVSLPTYIREKVKLMHDFGYRTITKEFFSGCTSEIQVDQRAHNVLLG